jgi:hypothetical protein
MSSCLLKTTCFTRLSLCGFSGVTGNSDTDLNTLFPNSLGLGK